MARRFTIDGRYHPDSRSVDGRVVFDGRSLYFRGERGSEWSELVTIAARVTACALAECGRALVVWDGARAHRFSGVGVEKLADVVQAALDARRRLGDALPFAAEPGEQLLGDGDARWAPTPASSVPGRLFVTDRRVHFEPDDAAMSSGSLAPTWSASHRALRGSQVDATRGFWRAEAAGGRRAVFRGDFALRAASIADSLQDAPAGPSRAWLDRLVREPSQPQRPLRLVADDGDIRLVRADVEPGVSTALRARGALESLSEVRAQRGSEGERVQLKFDSGSWCLRCEQASEVVDEIVWAALAAAGPLREGPIDDYFELIEPAACWLGASSVRFGWIALGAQFVHFIPRQAGPSGEEAIRIPVSEVRRGDCGADAASLIQVLGRAVQLVLSPASGEAFVARFWERWEHADASGDQSAEHTDNLALLAGPATLVRVSRHGRGLLEVPDSFITVQPGPLPTLTVLVSGVPDQALDIGLPVHVEVARGDAVYVFDAIIWWQDRAVHAPAGVAEVFRGFRLELVMPPVVQRYNRRQDYRVPLEPPRLVQVRRLDGEEREPEPAMLLDVSASGCRLSSNETPPAHAQLEVQLDLEGRRLLLRGEVLHVFGPRAPHEACQLGVRFHQLEARDHATVVREVMTQQRALLRDRHFLREALEEAFSA